MRILVTRPQEDAQDFAEALHRLGHQTFIEPLLAIEYLQGPPLALDGVQAILITSANGARTLVKRTTDKTRTILAVGPATAATARALGFTDVRESDGDGVTGLANFAARELKPDSPDVLKVDRLSLYLIRRGDRFGIRLKDPDSEYRRQFHGLEYFPANEAYWRMPTVLLCTGFGMSLGGWLAGYLYDFFGFYTPAFATGVAANFLNFALIGFLVSRQLRNATAYRVTAHSRD